MNEAQKREAVGRVAAWFHSCDFGDGVRVSGHEPLDKLRREWGLLSLPDLTGQSVIETQAMTTDGLEHVPLCENYGPLHALNADSSNRWSPNALAPRQMLLAVGFESAEITVGPPAPLESTSQTEQQGLWPSWRRTRANSNPAPPQIRHDRAYAHARRSMVESTGVNPVPLL